jgi:hypothetical protein
MPASPGAGQVIDLAEMFPGVTGANRLWGYFPSGGAFSVSHP